MSGYVGACVSGCVAIRVGVGALISGEGEGGMGLMNRTI